jgi:ADP-heptose:LPS heptosyltransferase
MKKILIIRFSSIGDIVLTTPVIRCLKEQLTGGVNIHYLTKEQFAPLLGYNPNITKIHVIKQNIREVIHELRKEKFDHIIDLHRNFRSVGIWMNLLTSYSTFRKLNFKKWILVRFKINLLPDIHIVDRYFRAVASLGVKNDGKALDYYIPEKDYSYNALIPESCRKGFVAFVIGARHQTKCLPEDMIAAVCKQLFKPVVLIGGPEDRAKGERIREMVEEGVSWGIDKDGGQHVINACGKYTLNQSACIINNAEKIISNDTGMMHIAAALGKPILSIWGNTVPAFGMYPYFPVDKGDNSKIVEVNGLSCRPCSKLGYATCPLGHFKCMRMIPVDQIADWANGK